MEASLLNPEERIFVYFRTPRHLGSMVKVLCLLTDIQVAGFEPARYKITGF